MPHHARLLEHTFFTGDVDGGDGGGHVEDSEAVKEPEADAGGGGIWAKARAMKDKAVEMARCSPKTHACCSKGESVACFDKVGETGCPEGWTVKSGACAGKDTPKVRFVGPLFDPKGGNEDREEDKKAAWDAFISTCGSSTEEFLKPHAGDGKVHDVCCHGVTGFPMKGTCDLRVRGKEVCEEFPQAKMSDYWKNFERTINLIFPGKMLILKQFVNVKKFLEETWPKYVDGHQQFDPSQYGAEHQIKCIANTKVKEMTDKAEEILQKATHLEQEMQTKFDEAKTKYDELKAEGEGATGKAAEAYQNAQQELYNVNKSLDFAKDRAKHARDFLGAGALLKAAHAGDLEEAKQIVRTALEGAAKDSPLASELQHVSSKEEFVRRALDVFPQVVKDASEDAIAEKLQETPLKAPTMSELAMKRNEYKDRTKAFFMLSATKAFLSSLDVKHMPTDPAAWTAQLGKMAATLKDQVLDAGFSGEVSETPNAEIGSGSHEHGHGHAEEHGAHGKSEEDVVVDVVPIKHKAATTESDGQDLTAEEEQTDTLEDVGQDVRQGQDDNVEDLPEAGKGKTLSAEDDVTEIVDDNADKLETTETTEQLPAERHRHV